jgi:hypothetical protein
MPYFKTSVYDDLKYLTRDKEGAKSFILKEKDMVVKREKIGSVLMELKKGNFIDQDTESSTFYALFNGINMNDKINWKDDLTTLHTFVDLLTKKKSIELPTNKPPYTEWEIAAACFTYKGERLDKSKLSNHHGTKNRVKKKQLEDAVKML